MGWVMLALSGAVALAFVTGILVGRSVGPTEDSPSFTRVCAECRCVASGGHYESRNECVAAVDAGMR
jgi:hypothetical protein